MDLEEYKKKYKQGEAPPEDAELRKQFVIEPIVKADIKETEDGLQIPFTVSTEKIDRDQDTISVDGWNLENYKSNPVVLWAHDRRQPPVGKSINEWIDNRKLKSIAQFTPKDLNPFGYMIGQMYLKSFLSAVSVGFKASEAKWAVDRDTRPWGIDYFKQELLEYSCCPVPANPEALMDAKSAGIELEPMLDWAIKVLDEGIFVSKAKAEKIYSILSTKSTIVIPKTPKKSSENSLFLYEKQIQINNNRGL